MLKTWPKQLFRLFHISFYSHCSKLYPENDSPDTKNSPVTNTLAFLLRLSIVTIPRSETTTNKIKS